MVTLCRNQSLKYLLICVERNKSFGRKMSDVLLSVPLKSSSEIDIVTPLTAALKVRGYRPLESDWFKEFEKLRNLVVDKNIPKNQPSLETLCRYFPCCR